MVFHGFISHTFHAFMGNILTIFLLAWKKQGNIPMKTMEFCSGVFKGKSWNFAPGFSRKYMDFPHEFPMVFPWISDAFSTRVDLCACILYHYELMCYAYKTNKNNDVNHICVHLSRTIVVPETELRSLNLAEKENTK